MNIIARQIAPAFVLSLVIGFVNGARAQSASDVTQESTKAVSQAQGYAFYSIGALTCDGDSVATMHVGGGGELFAYRGFGLGGELGYLAPHQDWAVGVGVLSLDGSYHFARHGKWVPFVTGGYTLGFRSGYAGAINYGGGVQYWFKPKQGIRVEFRDIMDYSCGQCHALGLRIGYAFR